MVLYRVRDLFPLGADTLVLLGPKVNVNYLIRGKKRQKSVWCWCRCVRGTWDLRSVLLRPSPRGRGTCTLPSLVGRRSRVRVGGLRVRSKVSGFKNPTRDDVGWPVGVEELGVGSEPSPAKVEIQSPFSCHGPSGSGTRVEWDGGSQCACPSPRVVSRSVTHTLAHTRSHSHTQPHRPRTQKDYGRLYPLCVYISFSL